MPTRTSRGTTPTFQFDIDLDLTGWDVYVTMTQSKAHTFTFKPTTIEKTALGCSIYIDLTQEDSLKFIPGRGYAEVRAVNTDGVAVRTIDPMEFWIEDTFLDGVIPREVS